MEKKDIRESNNIIDKKNLKEIIQFKGIACSPYYECHDDNKIPSLKIKTLFMQEMIKNKVLMPWVSISYSHKQRELDKTMEALDRSKAYICM